MEESEPVPHLRCAHLERVDAVAAAHAVLHPALVIETGAVPGELLRRNLSGPSEFTHTSTDPVQEKSVGC